MFPLVSLSKSKFFSHVALAVCVALVSLVSNSCCTRVVLVALVLLVSFVFGTSVVKYTISKNLTKYYFASHRQPQI